MRIKDLATRATKLLTGNAWFVVDNGTKVEKAAYAEVVKQGIEEYAGSTLAGSAQTVKSAIDALNSNFVPYNFKAGDDIFTVIGSAQYRQLFKVGSVTGVTNMPSDLPESAEFMINVLFDDNTNKSRKKILLYYYNNNSQTIYTADMYGTNVVRQWVTQPTRAEMNAATVKTLTVTATADANGYIDTGLKYNQAVPLCVYSVTIDGSAAYPFLYEFLMRGGSPAEKIAVRIKRWNGEVYTGEVTFSMKYI